MADEAKENTNGDVPQKSMGFAQKIAIGAAIVVLQVALSVIAIRSFIPRHEQIPARAEEKEESKGVPDFDEVYVVEDVILNPVDSKGRRVINTTVAFAYDGKAGAELERREVQIRDMLIQLLSSCTTAQLGRPTFRDSLRQDILGRVRGIVKVGKIKGVYFANFVMQ